MANEYPAIMAAQMQEFNPDSETVRAYLDQFQMFAQSMVLRTAS